MHAENTQPLVVSTKRLFTTFTASWRQQRLSSQSGFVAAECRTRRERKPPDRQDALQRLSASARARTADRRLYASDFKTINVPSKVCNRARARCFLIVVIERTAWERALPSSCDRRRCCTLGVKRRRASSSSLLIAPLRRRTRRLDLCSLLSSPPSSPSPPPQSPPPPPPASSPASSPLATRRYTRASERRAHMRHKSATF